MCVHTRGKGGRKEGRKKEVAKFSHRFNRELLPAGVLRGIWLQYFPTTPEAHPDIYPPPKKKTAIARIYVKVS